MLIRTRPYECSVEQRPTTTRLAAVFVINSLGHNPTGTPRALGVYLMTFGNVAATQNLSIRSTIAVSASDSHVFLM